MNCRAFHSYNIKMLALPKQVLNPIFSAVELRSRIGALPRI